MSKNILVFRTDRIGDFLLSAVLIKAIKRKYQCDRWHLEHIKDTNLMVVDVESGVTELLIEGAAASWRPRRAEEFLQ